MKEVDPLVARLWTSAPSVFPDQPPVAWVEAVTADVWRVEFADGRRLVAKHPLFGWATQGMPHDLLAVEERVLGLLAESGCPVPRFLGVDGEAQLIFLEDCGPRTLDDELQEAPEASRAQYAPLAINGLGAIEQGFQKGLSELLPCVSPAADQTSLARAWAAAGVGAGQGLAYLLAARPAWQSVADRRLQEILKALAARRPSLGSVDYNARNVVVDPARGRLSFIEFSAIGWDWPERRLVQYTSSLGAGRPDGNFQPLLDRQVAALYAGCGGDLQALDYHYLIFLLNAVARLGAALKRPEEEASRALLAAWQNPRQRLARLVEKLAAPLSDDPLASELRGIFDKLRETLQLEERSNERIADLGFQAARPGDAHRRHSLASAHCRQGEGQDGWPHRRLHLSLSG